eukprot:1393034-Amorphochlora_amoeboformis.AAC.1
MKAMGKGVARSRGAAQTELLRANINDQINRLLDQLEDLEELKDEIWREISMSASVIRTDNLRKMCSFPGRGRSKRKGVPMWKCVRVRRTF